MRFETSVILFTLGALASASATDKKPRQSPVRPAHFPVMQTDLVSHEICSRAVDRMLNDNVDPNKVLNEAASSGTPWTDSTFAFPGAFLWEDMKVADEDS